MLSCGRKLTRGYYYARKLADVKILEFVLFVNG